MKNPALVLARRMGAYTTIQILGFVSPFAALPVIARATTKVGWSGLGIGQAIGGMAGIIILYGWWTIGPSEYIKHRDQASRAALYLRSLAERSALALVVLPLSCIAAAVVDPGARTLAAVSVIGLATVGLSPQWYFIAAASPWKLALYETGPRILAAAGSAVLVAVTGHVMIYPILLAVIPLAAYAVALMRETPIPKDRKVLVWDDIRADLRRQVPVAGSNIVGGLYSQLMVPYVALLVPAHLPLYVSGDRLYKAGRFTITAAGNTFQPWALEQPTRKRHLAAICGHAGLGLLGFLASWLVMPPASRIMFGSTLAVPAVLGAGLGAGFMFNSILTPLIRNILIPQGRRTAPLVATVCAALTGIATAALLRGEGLTGIAIAVGLSEFVCCAISGLFALPLLRATR